MRTSHAFSLIAVVGSPVDDYLAQAQEKIDRDIQWKIRREAIDNSQIMRTLQVLTDVYGPRLTGSPNLKAASDWVIKETTAWGLKNAHLEPWTFGHPGLAERADVGSRRLAGQGRAGGRGAGLDAWHERARDGPDRGPGTADATDAGAVVRVPGRRRARR